jgi:hypothetical protein
LVRKQGACSNNQRGNREHKCSTQQKTDCTEQCSDGKGAYACCFPVRSCLLAPLPFGTHQKTNAESDTQTQQIELVKCVRDVELLALKATLHCTIDPVNFSSWLISSLSSQV